MQPAKIDIAAIDDTEAARLDAQLIEPGDDGLWSGADRKESRQGATQVECRVQLHTGTLPGPVRPRTESDTQLNQRRVHRIDRNLQLESVRLVLIKLPARAINLWASALNKRQSRRSFARASVTRWQTPNNGPSATSPSRPQCRATLPESHLRKSERQKVIPRENYRRPSPGSYALASR